MIIESVLCTETKKGEIRCGNTRGCECGEVLVRGKGGGDGLGRGDGHGSRKESGERGYTYISPEVEFAEFLEGLEVSLKSCGDRNGAA